MPEQRRTPRGRSQDRKLISLEQPHEVRYWTEALGVSEEQLRMLVKMHGNSVEPIREALNKKAA
jgi:hypothetical protein